MRVKHLEPILEDLEGFENPKVELEQFITPSHIAANMLNFIEADIQGKMVADLGSGCGMLSIGASLSGAGFVFGFEIDESALKVAQKNKKETECDNIDFIQTNILSLRDPRWAKKFDTVIMNPPFGTRNKGIDSEFLFTAASLTRKHIYSFHKMSTMDHIEKIASVLKLQVKKLDIIQYNLDKSYKHHKKNSRDISVCLVRFSKMKTNKKKK